MRLRASHPAEVPRRRPLLRTAGQLLALAFRLVPKHRRFRAAVTVARWLEPLIARTGVYETRLQQRTDSLREVSLDLLLTKLTRYGTTFDPVLHIDGVEHVTAAMHGATLVVGPHTMLSILFLRRMLDLGRPAFVITPETDLRVAGTRTPARVLAPSPALLLQVRRQFRNGEIVTGMIDRGEPERRNAVFQTVAGPMLVSDALLRLALRQDVRILFIATKLDPSYRIVMRLGAPSPASETVDAVLLDFTRFVDETHLVTCEPPMPVRASA